MSGRRWVIRPGVIAMHQLDLFSAHQAAERINPHGAVCTRDQIDDEINLGDRHLGIRIQLARHHDGRYMWGTSFHTPTGGSGYWIGPKWGKFATTIMDALRCAKQEITENASSFEHGKKVVRLLEGLAT